MRAAVGLAGHAVACYLEGIEFSLMSLKTSCAPEPFIDVEEPFFPSQGAWSFREISQANATIRALLAGPAATQKYDGVCSLALTLDDREIEDPAVWRALDIAGAMPSRLPVLPPLWCQTVASINRPCVWRAVTALATELVRTRKIAGQPANAIIADAMRTQLRLIGI